MGSFNLMLGTLKKGIVPDAGICSAGLAKAVSSVLADFKIDNKDRCRIVSYGEVNGKKDFTGIILPSNAQKQAEKAVKMLSSM